MKKRKLTKNPLNKLSIIFFIIFLIILLDLLFTKQLLKLDYLVNNLIQNIQSPLLTKTFIFITNFGNTIPLIIFTIFLLIFLYIRKKYSHLILLILSMLTGLVIELSIKYLVHRIRPSNGLIQASTYSFPSGHATMAVIFFSILLYSIIETIKSKKTKLILSLIIISIILLIGFSRIYLNVHYFSDVLAGLVLGLFINSTTLLLIEKIYKK